MRRFAAALVFTLLSFALTNEALAQQAQVLHVHVLGPVLGAPPALVRPPSARQQLALAEVGDDGSIAVLVYRFSQPDHRLPRAFFNASVLQSLTVVPVAACPSTLRAVVFQKLERYGSPVKRLAFTRLRGAHRGLVMAHLDEAPRCYLIVAGGAQ